MFGSVKDGHVGWMPQCYAGTFKWGHEFPLVSIGKTPTEVPEIFTVSMPWGTTGALQILDKVVKINDEPAAEFLYTMAKTDPMAAWIDPDARYNELFAQIRSGMWSSGAFAFRSAFYEDPIKLEFENGTKHTIEWTAVYVGVATISTDISWVDTASFYRNMCLRTQYEIDAYINDETVLRPTMTRQVLPTLTVTRNIQGDGIISAPTFTPYPKSPRLEKRQLLSTLTSSLLRPPATQTSSTSRVTSIPKIYPRNATYISTPAQEVGFYLLDNSTGVITIDSFTPLASTPTSSCDSSCQFSAFQGAFSRFITLALATFTTSNIHYLLIDLSGNGGGSVPLGQDLARQIFPTSSSIFFGENMRHHPVLRQMLLNGDQETINQTYFDIGHFRTPENTDFTSYSDFLGPVFRDADYFTKIAIPDEVEANIEAENNLTMAYPSTDPFPPQNVGIITSGLCGSTCALAAEALTASGARSIAFGGRPRPGPMQLVGGIKGSQVLDFDEIIYFLSSFLPRSWRRLSSAPSPLKIRGVGTVNFRNSWRRSAHMPIEYIYDPAEKRVWYTAAMTGKHGLEEVHKVAREVLWGNGGDVGGGEYVPVNGFDGELWRGDGVVGGIGAGWRNLGELIWGKMGREVGVL